MVQRVWEVQRVGGLRMWCLVQRAALHLSCGTPWLATTTVSGVVLRTQTLACEVVVHARCAGMLKYTCQQLFSVDYHRWQAVRASTGYICTWLH
jgi:hypothetical protein